MSLDQKFKQRWEFRKRDDEIGSSSDDSSDEAVRNRHKLIPNLVSPENGEENDNLRSQEKSQIDSNTKVNIKLLEAPRKHIDLRAVKHKVKRAPVKETKKQKKKCSTREQLLLEDFKVFTESMIAEIRDARQNLFAQMREEMKKLAAVKSTIRPRRKEDSRRNSVRPPQIRIKSVKQNQNCSDLIVEQCGKSNKALDSKLNYKAVEDQVNVDLAVGTIPSNRIDKGKRSIPYVQKSIGSANDSDQIVSSSYLTLPGVLLRPHVSHQKTGFYLRNHIQPGIAIDNPTSNLEWANSAIGVNNRHRYLSNIQPDEQFGSLVPFSSKDSSFLDKHSTQTSAMCTGFPIPLHQGLRNFNRPSQILLEEFSRENSRMSLGTSGGATKLSQGSRALAESFIANCISSHVNYKTDGVVLPYKSGDLNTGNSH